MPHPLVKIETSLLQDTQQTRHADYSREIKDPSLFASAMTQRLASVEMEESKISGGALLCLNTLALRSFQIVHETSIVREALAWQFGIPSA